jgi:serine/threonine protein kinase/tetratricopeptide (TPR) repeat protein
MPCNLGSLYQKGQCVSKDPAHAQQLFQAAAGQRHANPPKPLLQNDLRAFFARAIMSPMLEIIGHYRIRRKIGQGAMGVVYEGWDSRLERAVAIKTIDEAHESREARRSLWREARSLARVNHPHVCQVYDVLEESDGLVLVMELLEGQSLADLLLTGTINASEALSIVRQMLQALQALHDLGIVHRDLKPSNVFLTRHGVKLLDFGIARTTDAALTGDSHETRTAVSLIGPGVLVGTPLYMSPEQARGLPAGPAADIFSVGCIFYELLTGKRPFEGASLVDILYAVLHRNPPPLSGSREIEGLDRIIRRALAKSIEDRFGSAHEMLGALELIRLSGSTAVSPRTRTISRMIVLPFRTLRRDEQIDFLSFTLPDAISNSLSAMDNLIVRSGLLASRFDGQPDPRRVAVEADVDAFLTGSLLRAGDRFRLTCQLIEAPGGTVIWSESANSSMQDLFTIQDELCDRILQSLQLPLEERERRASNRDVPASARAYEYYLRANQIVSHRNRENITLGRDLCLQCLDESPEYAPAWVLLGRMYHLTGKFIDDVDQNAERAEQAFSRAFALNPDLASAHHYYTAAECDHGHSQKAMLRLLEQARFRRNDPGLFAGLVQACRYCDELESSVAAYLRARHLDPHVITSVAHTYFMMGDYASAIDCYGKNGYYLDCAALAAMGEDQTALSMLRAREQFGPTPAALQGIMRSLRAYLEGNWDECCSAITTAEDAIRRDPEILFYSARQLARIHQTDRAMAALSYAIGRGFLGASAMSRDPWLEPLRSCSGYAELLQETEQRRVEMHAAFLTAGAEQLISVA